MNTKELLIEATVDALDKVADFLEAQCAAVGCDEENSMQLMLVVEEIFVNIANYAYSPEVGEVTIRIAVSDGKGFVIEFEDKGKPFNPLVQAPQVDVDTALKERRVGGLGIHLVKRLSDSVTYKNENGKNILTVKKLT